MQKRGLQVVAAGDTAWRQAALAIDSALVLATPVDTGRARSNWRVTSGSPASGTIEPYSPGSRGSTGDANATSAIRQGQQAIAAATGNVIYITNNLDYIGLLNAGHSAQAPAGFVELAVQAGVNAVKGVRILK